jgi:Flp pilus assembly protein TadB
MSSSTPVLWFICVLISAIPMRPRSLPSGFALPEKIRHNRAHDVFGWVGRKLLRAIRIPIPVADVDLGRICIVGVALAFASPGFSFVFIMWSVAGLRRRKRSHARERVARVRSDLSLLIDLLRVAITAGMTLQQAILLVCRDAGELSGLLLAAVHGIDRGERFIDGLSRIGDDEVIGLELRLFVSTLVSAEQFGTSLGPSLGQLAEDVRDTRRRLAETEARRVPVRMLAPLVLLLLPSFALLTVAPLLAGGLASLRLN